MSKEKITISEIVDLMASRHHFSKKQTEEFVKMLLSTVEDMLIDGEAVKIKDFGTFKPQWNEPRKSVDVNTGEEITIPGYYKVVFVPENDFKELINKPFSHLKPVEKPLDTEEKTDETGEKEPISEDAKVTMEPMRIFEEQANQIKGLLDEIEAMSGKKRSEEIVEKEDENQIEKEEDNISEEEENAKNQTEIPDSEEDKIETEDIIEEEDENLEIDEKRDVEEEKPDVSEGTHFFASFEDRKTRKLRKKLEREEQKKRRREEIKQYFEENDFNVVRELHPQKEEISAPLDEEEHQDAFPEDFAEDIVSEVEPVVSPQTSVEKEDIVQESSLTSESEEETIDEDITERADSDEIKIEENIIEPKEDESGFEETKLTEDDLNEESSVEETDSIVSESLTDEESKEEFVEEDIVESQNIISEEKSKTIDEIQQEIQKKKILEENIHTEKNVDYTFTPAKKKNRRIWWFVLIPLLILAAAFGVWKSFPYLKSYLDLYWNQQKDSVKTTQIIVPQATIVIPAAKSDSALTQSADTLSAENIFEKEREYKDFVASEVIKQGVTLKTLAKKYLGNDAFWIYIYEANIDVIEDPKNVALGTVVRIPKVSPELINVNNPKCIPYANKLSAEYLYYENK
ncbi:hypothetical protein TRIP_D300173 [uncultured Paludibacter sp.]|nr:hypothetical protein TRIP_D300173 [uncultured Paludibacter sp.]